MGLLDCINNFNILGNLGYINPFSNAFSFFQNLQFNIPLFSSFNSSNMFSLSGCSLFDYNRFPLFNTSYTSTNPYMFNSTPTYTPSYPVWNTMGLNLSSHRSTTPAAIQQAKPITNYSQVRRTNPTPTTSNPKLFTNSGITIQKVNKGNMPYLVIAPKDVNPNEKLPVLIYLHGKFQVGGTLNGLQKQPYDPAVIMSNWKLNNFRGYIICPLLKSGSWNTKSAERNLRNLYNNFASTHNIDRSKVAVAGASLGGLGALYMANAMSDVFRKAVAFSPYNPGNLGNGLKIPTRAYVGSRDDGNSISFTKGRLAQKLGAGNCYTINGATHISLAGTVFRTDKNNNGCSDVLEWLFT